MKTFKERYEINVNDKVEKKGKFNYLSWPYAVQQLMIADESATWTYNEIQKFNDTYMVSCSVTAFGKTMTCHLPVFDHAKNCIKNPTAKDINVAMQRALVKAIALHGIGLYIYAGEDLPDLEEAKTDPNAQPKVNEPKVEIKPQATPSPFIWGSLKGQQFHEVSDLVLERFHNELTDLMMKEQRAGESKAMQHMAARVVEELSRRSLNGKS
jgi:hypothetical protein